MTVTSVSALLVRFRTYVASPPSATAAVPLMLRVVAWMVSVTAVTAAVSLTFSFSKLPPLVSVIFAETLPASI
ncbi:hypothetical protein D3C79_799710 [compost metagenome]